MKRSEMLQAAAVRRAQILAAIEAGATHAELARQLGVSREMIGAIVRRAKRPPRRRPRAIRPG